MKRFTLSIIFSLVTLTANAADLTWADLVRKPDLRPAACTLKETISFQSGAVLKAGQKFTIDNITKDEVLVSLGRNAYSLNPEQTDVLAQANAAYAKLTPQQRALTYAEILKRPELWPYRLKVKAAFDFGRERITKGSTVYLMEVVGSKLRVVPQSFSQNVDLAPEDTDIMETARAYVEQGGGPGIIAEELQGKLADGLTMKPINPDLSKVKYFLIYDGARWCPYTQAFTPHLLKVYQTLKAKGRDDFEVIYMPSEKTAVELQTYAKEMNFPWPVMFMAQKKRIAVLAKHISGHSLPVLQVLDRYGRVVISNGQFEREEVLSRFVQLMDQTHVAMGN